jgi:hypothetical protein
MGQELVRRKGVAVAVAVAVLLALSCREKRAPAAKGATNEPQVRATVVTLQTTLQPENKTLTHRIVIHDQRVRSMDELDVWRLIDLEKNNVTFVNDVTKTYRTESIASIVTKRRAAHAQPMAETALRAEFATTNAERVIHGVKARQSIVRAGAYLRELWFASHPALPDNLFAVLHGTEAIPGTSAPMMKNAEEALLKMRGFPLSEHAELPFGKNKMVLDRNVVKIETADVPEKTFNVPADYRNLAPPLPKR